MSKIFKFVFLVILTLNFVSYSIAQNKSAMDLKAVKLDFHYEILGASAQIDNFDRTMYIVFSDKYWILKEPYNHFESVQNIVNGEVSDRKFIEIRYHYFVAKKGSSKGLAYFSISPEKNHVSFAVDSLINNYLETPGGIYPAHDALRPTTKIIRDKKNGFMVEKIKHTTYDEVTQDSVYFYYQSKPISLPFYNKSIIGMDMYMVKCEAIFNAKPNGILNYKFPLPKRKWKFEISETEVPEKAEMLTLIERFKKDAISDVLPVVKRK